MSPTLAMPGHGTAEGMWDPHPRVMRRLSAEFVVLSADTIERCVTDVGICALHLGLDATPQLVEGMARERLLGMVKSEPPSGQRA
jgi:hypothetical protein